MKRRLRLSAAVVAMILIGNLQYAWTLFVNPIISATHCKLSEVQWSFTFFIALATWVMPLSGVTIDKLGPQACCAACHRVQMVSRQAGLAAGLITAGYGSGAALFNPIFTYLIRESGYCTTLQETGIAQGVFILIAGLKVQRHNEEFNSSRNVGNATFLREGRRISQV